MPAETGKKKRRRRRKRARPATAAQQDRTPATANAESQTYEPEHQEEAATDKPEEEQEEEATDKGSEEATDEEPTQARIVDWCECDQKFVTDHMNYMLRVINLALDEPFRDVVCKRGTQIQTAWKRLMTIWEQDLGSPCDGRCYEESH